METAEVIREVNRRIYEISAGHPDDVPLEFLCECGCMGLVPVFLRDYAPTRAVYLPGHEARATESATASLVPFCPGTEATGLYRYRLHTRDGADAGEAEYAVRIKPGELIYANDGRKLRVLDVVPVLKAESRYAGLLMVEPVEPRPR